MNRVLVLLVAVLVALLALSGSALGATDFVRVGAFNEAVPDGQAAHQHRIAVNQATDAVYVTDPVNDQIAVYTSAGTGADLLTSFGSGVLTDPFGIAVDQSTGDVYVSDDDQVVKFVSDGAATPTFTQDITFTSPAVTGPLAFDQVNHQLLVADTATNTIRRYGTSGTAGATLDGTLGTDAPGAFTGLQDLAVDSAGDLVIVDATGNPARSDGSVSRVERFTTAGDWQTIGPVEQAATVAIHPGDDNVIVSGHQNTVYSSGNPTLQEFSPDGTAVGELATDAALQYATVSGMAADDGVNGRLLVATDVGDYPGYGYGYTSVQVYRRPLPPVAPTIADTSVTPSHTEAYVTATINPNRAATTYHVDYGPTDAYGTSTPTRTIAPGDAPVEATIYITGLTPGATYHYRLVADNAEGHTTSADQTFTTAGDAPQADACPNAAIRAQQNAQNLPDCRAFEQVSPVDKNGANVSLGKPAQSAVAPGAIAYTSSTGLPGGPTTLAIGWYRAKRSDTGWTTDFYDLPADNPNTSIIETTKWISPDLSKSVTSSSRALTPDTPTGAMGVYLHDLRTDGLRLIADDPNGALGSLLYDAFMGISPGPVWGATDDLRHVVFQTKADLGHGVTSGTLNVWEWVDGQLRLVDRMIDGAPSPLGAAAKGQRTALQFPNVISADGSKVFFTALDQFNGSVVGAIYVRENGATTRLVSHSQRSGDDPAAPVEASFVGASRDGRYVFLLSRTPLTDDPTDVGGMYRADLSDNTITLVAAGAPEAGTSTVRISDDGGRIYFSTTEALVAGADPKPGAAHLYLWDGALKLVANLGVDNFGSAAVSGDGRFLEFSSTGALTGFDRTSAACPDSGGAAGVCYEMYAYDALTGHLACASCPPAGVSGGTATTGVIDGAQNFALYAPRSVLDDGTRIFDTPNALVSEDVNRKRDVYAWKDGQVRLLSSGVDRHDASFLDTSADGTDVYFATVGRLVAQDTDALRDIYSARRDGGLAIQNADTTAPSDCSLDSCQGPSSGVTPLPIVGSLTFTGEGNLPDGRSTVPAGAVRVSKLKTVVGTTATLKVRVPVAGAITVSGAGVRAVKRSATKAATYAVKLSLSTKSKSLLKKRKTLRVKVRVAFTPKTGEVVTSTVTVTFKQPKARVGHGAGKGGR